MTRGVALALLIGLSLAMRAPLAAQQAPGRRDSTVGEETRARLAELAEAQRGYFREHERYAGSGRQLGYHGMSDDAGPTIMIVTAGRDGWSAVARHERLSTVRCAIAEGTAPPLLDRDAVSGQITCVGEVDRIVPPRNEAPNERPGESGVVYDVVKLDDPVQVLSCSEPTHVIPDFKGRAVFRYIVDAAGTVEPTSFAVLQADNHSVILYGMYRITNCRFWPARLDGRPVRQMVQQAVNVH